MRRFSIFHILLILLMSELSAEVVLDPPELLIDARELTDGSFSRDIRIENRDKRPLSLTFVTEGEELTVSPSSLELEGGEVSTFKLKGPDPGDEPGVLILLSEREDVPYLYSIRRKTGTVLSGLEPSGHPSLQQAGEDVFVFFYTPGCSICEEFYNNLMPGLIKEYSLPVLPDKRNIYDSGNFEFMRELLNARGADGTEFPILVRGNAVFQGEDALFRHFPAYLADPSGMAELDENPKETRGSSGPDRPWAGTSRLRWLTVFLAGLLDGINPCAFTTLIFLISYLRLLGRKGREILLIGISFTSAVFITYFLIGLGLFQMIRLASSFHMISQIIRFAMIALLALLSVLSLYDFFKVRQGRGAESILQLSAGIKKRIHRTVRMRTRSPFLLLSSFAAGAAISLYELGCTGQIYLPMLVYMVRQKAGLSTVGPLFLYNTGFILPLVLVFYLFYKGSDSAGIADYFNRHLGAVKLATALLFALIAILLLLTA